MPDKAQLFETQLLVLFSAPLVNYAEPTAEYEVFYVFLFSPVCFLCTSQSDFTHSAHSLA